MGKGKEMDWGHGQPWAERGEGKRGAIGEENLVEQDSGVRVEGMSLLQGHSVLHLREVKEGHFCHCHP